MSKLIGKSVEITNKGHWAYGERGIVKHIDGEYYDVAITGDDNMVLIFTRDEFKVCRGSVR